MPSDSQTEIRILSRAWIRPSPPPSAVESRRRQIHLNPWDLNMLSVGYIQKGILLPAPNPPDDLIVPRLISSFSQTLDLFYPFAGRLATVYNPTSPPSLYIFLDCNDAGGEFIHAAADHLTSSDITSSHYTPPEVRSLFPLNDVINHDGHTSPLLAMQATVLGDGSIFLAGSLNHAVADGYSFWHFFNTWSWLTRSGSLAADSDEIQPPVVEHWFLPSTPPPIMLPFRDESEFIHRDLLPPTRECFFNFSRQSVARLKAKANEEMGVQNISSLQSLLAHMWRAATRARGLEPDVETAYVVIVSQRRRITPPLPDTYMGNTALGAPAIARAGELAGNGLGWAAWQLNRAVAFEGEGKAVKWLEEWAKNPSPMRLSGLAASCRTLLITGSSPRFNVYGNDFGWGPPEAVRSGGANKVDGKVTVYSGRSGAGSMALEVCLTASALRLLLEDQEFMSAVDTCCQTVVL
ncbi:hypothetical protein KSP39_PZI001738 [Platanthera zijinensis]|uniref:Acetyltransferase n=1 Tax=Platanthera zijinensis TaxID=2320716 RepID=A0AAP0GE48_9ASPA